ncbi:dTDP-4-dehydrorhamnose 3,5-epimerase [Brevibacillus sp. Leaf182]|uniref:dTDP-4-dehydrorhamnose 3,5-epimerase n=1 Tax=Brevibacillus sp. Leaf182 TaxID=1736290 RepID=UPI0006FB3933|nr:dTDP-4-dehydrorhamnose 3,5-epimerase [Brevibacillus sp. Leaf182]RAT98703.1 dTDP-4-dehydrorhamnose 3,5-epimerase [Brevibacillus sp. Leaf182]
MKIHTTMFDEVFILEPQVFGDHRGYFMESFHADKLAEVGIRHSFVQDNQSLSATAGTIRGLHYQLSPKAQAKLVRVLSGAILDVVVDIRRKSPTYGKSLQVLLSEENKQQLYVPEGFAHGFCTLSDNTVVFYKVNEYYSPEHDRGILWNDPDLGIEWPVETPILSEKDTKQPRLHQAENNF